MFIDIKLILEDIASNSTGPFERDSKMNKPQ